MKIGRTAGQQGGSISVVDEVLPGELVAEAMTLRCWRVDDAPMLA
jgi:hypothetical protein